MKLLKFRILDRAARRLYLYLWGCSRLAMSRASRWKRPVKPGREARTGGMSLTA